MKEPSWQPLVSVVIPVYNKVDFIQDTLRSVSEQTYGLIEIIIVDDGSTDGSSELLIGIDNGNFILLQQENRGVEAARNNGWASSHGDLVIFLDADDKMSRTRVSSQVDEFRKDASLVLVGTWSDVIDESGRTIGKLQPPSEDRSLKHVLRFHNPFACSSVMIRRDAIEGIPFPITGNSRFAEDYDLWVRIAKSGKVKNIRSFETSYRRIRNSRSQSLDTPLNRSAEQIAARDLRSKVPGDISDSSIIELIRSTGDWSEIFALESKRLSTRTLKLYFFVCRQEKLRMKELTAEFCMIIFRHSFKILAAEFIRSLPMSSRHLLWNFVLRVTGRAESAAQRTSKSL